MRLASDPELRKATYALYRALFKAKQACPNDFSIRRLTTIQTAYMGLEDVGWRVVGITPEALDLLATVDFDKHKLPHQLCRGHIESRVNTARRFFDRDRPLPQREFIDTFLASDCTVIMLKGQNRHGQAFPAYISIENPLAELFPNHALIGWKHRRQERAYLRALHARLTANQRGGPIRSKKRR